MGTETQAAELTRIGIAIENRQVAYLDRLIADAREITGVVLDRSQILRALIDAAAERGISAGKVRSEDDLRRIVGAKG